MEKNHAKQSQSYSPSKKTKVCSHWKERLFKDILIIIGIVIVVFLARELFGWFLKTTMSYTLLKQNNTLLKQVLSHTNYIANADIMQPFPDDEDNVNTTNSDNE